MPQRELVIREKVITKGIFDFTAFYGYAYAFLKESGFTVIEKKYIEDVKGDERTLRIEWRANKEISDYFKIDLEITLEGKKLTEIEAEIDGEKKEMNQGEIEVEIKGSLVKDPRGKWDTSASKRFFRDFYNKYIIPARVEDMKDKVAESVISLKEESKSFLELTAKR